MDWTVAPRTRALVARATAAGALAVMAATSAAVTAYTWSALAAPSAMPGSS